MKFRNFFTIFCLILIFVTANLAAEEKIHRIQGNISLNNGAPSVGTTVILMKIIMSGQASINPIAKKKTDTSGRVVFEVKADDEKVYYRLNVMGEDQIFGSEPSGFKSGESILSFDVRIPKTIEGLERLVFNRNLLIFELLTSAVRVTEILNMENQTQNTVDIRKSPIVKLAPDGLTDFQILDKKSGFDIQLSSGKIILSLVVPPGRHQVYFSYQLPIGQSDLSFKNDLLPNLKEVELIVPEGTMDVSFKNIQEPIIKSRKQSSSRIYQSQLIKLESPKQNIKIYIKNLPMSQKQLYYPAIILGIILLFGLFFFLNTKNKNLS